MKNTFISSVGKAGIGSRLRILQEKINSDTTAIYKLFGIELQPKWFPVLYTLSTGSFTITEIASHIGHSHPSVSTIVSEMVSSGLVNQAKDVSDGRRNLVCLSEQGKEISIQLQDQLQDISKAVEGILTNTQHNLWEAIEEWEFMLEQKSLLNRVKEEKKVRESHDVTIVPFDEQYRIIFRKLNIEWISTYFKLEAKDQYSLDNPSEYILDKGERYWLPFIRVCLWV